MTVAPGPLASVSAETTPLIQIKRLRRRGISICGSARLAEGNGMKWLLQFAVAAAIVAGLHDPKQAGAVDLAGAWATSADECPNVFVRRGRAKQIEFAALSDQHGGGFIVEADRLRGKFARCKIKSRKEDGDIVNIIAGCATDIMLSNVQFSLKILEPNKISRIFPGIEDMAISYHRCPI
jgi:hypothetical protein